MIIYVTIARKLGFVIIDSSVNSVRFWHFCCGMILVIQTLTYGMVWTHRIDRLID